MSDTIPSTKLWLYNKHKVKKSALNCIKQIIQPQTWVIRYYLIG